MKCLQVLASDDDLFSGRQIRIHKVRLYGPAGGESALLEDAVAATGSNDFINLVTLTAGATDRFDWGEQGITVSYLSVTLVGSPVLYIYYS